MKQYKLNPGILDKFIYQNKAEIVDCIDGVLLDDLLFYTRRGMIALFETYVNSNMSDFTVYFSTDTGEIWDLWEKRQEIKGVYDDETQIFTGVNLKGVNDHE